MTYQQHALPMNSNKVGKLIAMAQQGVELEIGL